MLGLFAKTQTAWYSLKARFTTDEEGATAIDYGLIAAGITVAIIAAAFSQFSVNKG